jgi:MFS family permease
MERFGIRRVMLIALVTVATGASLTTVMNAPWQLDLLWGVVVGGATGAVSVPLAATIANRWFESRRGFVTGILTASNASGQMIFLPLLAWLATAYGWRYAALAVAFVAMVVVFPIVAIFVRDRPQTIGLQPYGATEPVPVPTRSERPFRPAIDGLLLGVRSRTFWLLSSSFFICGLSTNGLIGTHLIPASIDHHMTAVAGASLLALMGLFDVVGTTVSGWLTDRLDPRRLLAGYYSLRGLAVIALPVAFGSGYALVAFAVFYGLDWVATVPPTVALTADHFGRERVQVSSCSRLPPSAPVCRSGGRRASARRTRRRPGRESGRARGRRRSNRADGPRTLPAASRLRDGSCRRASRSRLSRPTGARARGTAATPSRTHRCTRCARAYRV